jgi:hypothetical protein
VLDDAVVGDVAGAPIRFGVDVRAVEPPGALGEVEALAVELVDPLVLSLRKARPEARHPPRRGHSQQPPLARVKRLPGPPLVGDLARQEEPVAPEGAEDFQIPCLRREGLSVLCGKRVLVSKQEDAVASVDRRVAVSSSRLAVGLDRLVDRRKWELVELAHLAASWSDCSADCSPKTGGPFRIPGRFCSSHPPVLKTVGRREASRGFESLPLRFLS